MVKGKLTTEGKSAIAKRMVVLATKRTHEKQNLVPLKQKWLMNKDDDDDDDDV